MVLCLLKSSFFDSAGEFHKLTLKVYIYSCKGDGGVKAYVGWLMAISVDDACLTLMLACIFYSFRRCLADIYTGLYILLFPESETSGIVCCTIQPCQAGKDNNSKYFSGVVWSMGYYPSRGIVQRSTMSITEN